MAAKDWTKLYHDYKGLWVGLDTDEVTPLVYAQTLKEAVAKAKELNIRPRYTRIPEHDHYMTALYAANSSV